MSLLTNLTEASPINTVMGIDCSSKTFAFSVFEQGNLVMWGEIDFYGSNLYERMGSGQRRIAAFAQRLKVDKVVYESAVQVQNRKTVIDLAYSYGAAISPFIKPGVAVDTVSPMTWQNAIGNKSFSASEKAAVKKEYPDKSDTWIKNKIREMRKQRTIDWVKKEFGIEVESDNVSDAIALGWYAAVKNG